MNKPRRKREREYRAQSEIRCGVAPKRARRLKKQIGKSTSRGQDAGIPGGGAYPFPGDLRAKFAWKEANRLSRGELIDNTAVTCSSLDRRPTLILPPLLPSPSPSPPPLPPPPHPPAHHALRRAIQLRRNSLYLSRSARDTTQPHDPTIPDLPPPPSPFHGISRFDTPDVRNSLHRVGFSHVHYVSSVLSKTKI